MAIGWYVPHQNKIVRAIFAFQRILSNLKAHRGGINLIIRQAFLIFPHVAAVAIFVGYRMADLAFHLLGVDLVHFYLGIFGHGVRVAALAAGVFVRLVTTHDMSVCAVHFIRRVAFVAGHAFHVVNIRRKALVLSHEFFLNPTSVAGGAIGFHVRPLVEKMAVYETAVHSLGPADMALPAA